MYFKNDKFYDDWVMPLFSRMEPETAYAVAQQAAKYKLVSKEKLQESRLLVSTQPSKRTTAELERTIQEDEESSDVYDCLEGDFRGSREDLIGPQLESELTPICEPMCHSRDYDDSDCEPEDTCPDLCVEDTSEHGADSCGKGVDDDTCPHEFEGLTGGVLTGSAAQRRYLGDMNHYRSDLRDCDSPRSDRSCVTPDSPSLSMRVNVASPLRTSRMSLATLVDGSNPIYDRQPIDEAVDLADKVDSESNCESEDCIVAYDHDDCRTDIVSMMDSDTEEFKCGTEEELALTNPPVLCNATGPSE